MSAAIRGQTPDEANRFWISAGGCKSKGQMETSVTALGTVLSHFLQNERFTVDEPVYTLPFAHLHDLSNSSQRCFKFSISVCRTCEVPCVQREICTVVSLCSPKKPALWARGCPL